MGAYAAIPLQVRVPDAGQEMGRLLNLKAAATQGQMAQLQLMQVQRQMQDQNILRQSYVDAQGDPDRWLDNAARAGASPSAIMTMKTAILQGKEAMAKLTKEQADALEAKGNAMAGGYQALLGINYPDDPARTIKERATAAPDIVNAARSRGLISDQDAQAMLAQASQDPNTFFGDAHLKGMQAQAMGALKFLQASRESQQAATSAAEQQSIQARIPGEAARSQTEIRSNDLDALSKAAQTGNKDAYARAWYSLDPRRAALYPHPDEFDPQQTPELLNSMQMNPEQRAMAPYHKFQAQAEGLKVAGMVVPGIQNQEDWNRFKSGLPQDVQSVLPTYFSRQGATQVQQMGMTPDQRATLEARINEWNETNTYRQRRLEQFDAQNSLRQNRGGPGGPTATQTDRDYQAVLKNEASAYQERARLGAQLANADAKGLPKNYVDKSGKIIPMAEAQGDPDGLAQDMWIRYGVATDRAKTLGAQKNALIRRNGATPRMSDQDIYSSIDAADQKAFGRTFGAAQPPPEQQNLLPAIPTQQRAPAVPSAPRIQRNTDLIVTVNGRSYRFPDKQSADQFQQRASGQ